jgi:hypothetical protein
MSRFLIFAVTVVLAGFGLWLAAILKCLNDYRAAIRNEEVA